MAVEAAPSIAIAHPFRAVVRYPARRHTARPAFARGGLLNCRHIASEPYLGTFSSMPSDESTDRQRMAGSSSLPIARACRDTCIAWPQRPPRGMQLQRACAQAILDTAASLLIILMIVGATKAWHHVGRAHALRVTHAWATAGFRDTYLSP